MKKYNTPEIEALALETIDVIAISGDDAALYALESNAEYANYAAAAKNADGTAKSAGKIEDFTSTWSW